MRTALARRAFGTDSKGQTAHASMKPTLVSAWPARTHVTGVQPGSTSESAP